MRILTIMIMMTVAAMSFGAASMASTQSDSCRKCGEQKRACASAYSGPTCQADYDWCMKRCKQE